MTVRVNLLPEEITQRDRAMQQRLIAVAAGVFLLLVLGGALLFQLRQLSHAEDDLADAERQLAVARSEEAELRPFADIGQRVESAETQLTTALSTEVSLAGVLQDVAAVTPPDTGLTALNLTLAQPGGPATARSVGSLNLTGQVTSGIAPGVERVLLAYDKVGVFDEPFFNSTTVDPDGVATFSLDVGLLPIARTDRYSDGLPEELRR